MLCPSCGTATADTDQFCPECGKKLTGQAREEIELLSFGPQGVGVCFRRPSLSAPIIRNSTKITLTNRRIRGVPSGFIRTLGLFKAEFNVPFETILATEQLGYLVNRVLWINYRLGEEMKEVSVICSPRISGNIHRAYELIQNARTNLC
jgi:hypothetical protein